MIVMLVGWMVGWLVGWMVGWMVVMLVCNGKQMVCRYDIEYCMFNVQYSILQTYIFVKRLSAGLASNIEYDKMITKCEVQN